MNTNNATTQNVNSLLDQVSRLVHSISRAGTAINLDFAGDIVSIICFEHEISKSINLEEAGAMFKLNAVKARLEEIMPASQAMVSV